MSKQVSIEKLCSRSIGALMGVFIGDAFGLPVETQSPAAIRDKFGYLDRFVSNKGHRFKGVAKWGAGTKSDDSQLTLALMWALKSGYDLARIKKAHVDAAEGKWGEPIGWGGTTRNAVTRIKKGDRVTAIAEGAGNGTCMKIAPLAVYSVFKCRETPHGRFTNSFNASLLRKAREISTITHGDLNSTVAAYCQARMLVRALQGELPRDQAKIAGLFTADAIWAEGYLNADGLSLGRRLHNLFCEWRVIPSKDDIFLSRSPIDIFGLDTRQVSTMICTDKSSWVLHSYPLVAYCAAKYLPYWNFRYAIWETVNVGADSDSNASMVGALAGGYLGRECIPTDMIKGLKESKTLHEAAVNFVRSL